METAKLRRGIAERAANDTAEELGFRVKRINGEVFVVYRTDQVAAPGLPGEALLNLWDYAVRQRFNSNLSGAGKLKLI
jgi:hypothetical protein